MPLQGPNASSRSFRWDVLDLGVEEGVASARCPFSQPPTRGPMFSADLESIKYRGPRVPSPRCIRVPPRGKCMLGHARHLRWLTIRPGWVRPIRGGSREVFCCGIGCCGNGIGHSGFASQGGSSGSLDDRSVLTRHFHSIETNCVRSILDEHYDLDVSIGKGTFDNNIRRCCEGKEGG